MKRFISNGVALSLILGLFVLPLVAQQAQTSKPATDKININTANASELEKLPGIGPKVAQRIVDYRTKNGAFKKAEEIMKVTGIGEKIFARMKDMITV
jgi:competence protein ComEA